MHVRKQEKNRENERKRKIIHNKSKFFKNSIDTDAFLY